MRRNGRWQSAAVLTLLWRACRCCVLQGEPWSQWLQRVDRSMNIDIYLYVAGSAKAASAEKQ